MYRIATPVHHKTYSEDTVGIVRPGLFCLAGVPHPDPCHLERSGDRDTEVI